MQKITITVGRVTDVLKTFDYQLLSTADAETKAYERTLELASAMHKMNAQGTSNWSGRQSVGGYSNYIQQTTNIQKKQREETQRLRIATNELGTAYQSNVKNLNTYKANITKINKTLEQQRFRTAQLQAAQQSIYYKNAPNNLNTYRMNMDKINQSLERQIGLNNKNNNIIKQGTSSMRQFGTTMSKSEAYSNNLYRGLQKVRSVIVSMRTIMGAMGGMAIWNFAFDLVDKAKETYNAKNEMESLLNKNSHVNAEGMQVFNKALDDTIARFQKINKYSLGETAASIGLEFNLNGKEMADSLEVIGMIQNEYIRAGRTTEEAALAVKDILQGEFMRLSRETGVGKEELTDYGWNGNKSDIKSLMNALQKAAKDRHWDLFAEKATSVNDVITITQNRFGEFGADLLTNVEPMIVGAFNGILDVIDGISNAFKGLSTGEQITAMALGGTGAIVGLTSAILMLKKNIGLVDITTMGWSKSLATAIMGLKRADVITHGFWRTLIATVSGTDVATTANMRFTKVIAGRVLGVKSEIQAEHGLMSALMARKVELQKNLTLEKAAIIESGNFRQKLIYLAKGEVVANKEGATWGKTLKSLITSSKLLKIAMLGIMSVGIIAFFTTLATWTDAVKKRMESYKDILANGKDQIKEYSNDIEGYSKKIDELKSKGEDYSKVSRNLTVTKANKKDLEQALKLAKQIKKVDKETTKDNTNLFKGLINDSYKANGVNIEKYGQKYLQMRQVSYDMKKAEEERSKFLYASAQHINEQVDTMKEAGMSDKDRVKYITEYSTKAEEAAENLKKFNQGDLNAGAYYLINRAQLMWIDLWNNQHFIRFWNGVKKTWEEVKPTVYQMKDALISVGEGLADFFSTDFGRYIGMIGLFGTGIGLVALKIGKWVTGSGSVFEVLKRVGGKLKDVATGWKNVADNAEEANKKTGGTTSTGGIVGGTENTSLTTDLKNIGKNRLKSFTNNALILAEGMALVTEAILLIKAPMYALSNVGEQFKAQEPEIRKGIEGLQLVAPVIGAVLIPIVALHQILSRYGGLMNSWQDLLGNLKAFASMFLGIAAGMVLVAEGIYMLKAPMWSLAEVGKDFANSKNDIRQGVTAMKTVSESLIYLAPFVPMFAAGVVMTYLLFSNFILGASLYAAAIIGIPAGMLLLAEGILSLQYPLWSIAQLGEQYPDLDGVKRGAEAIKITAEAMGYLEEGLRAMTLIKWDILAGYIADLIGVRLGVDLTQLTGEGGFFDQLEDFTKEFNKVELTQIDSAKVQTLSDSATGIDTVKTALQTVKNALKDLPNFETDNRSPAEKYQDAVGGANVTDGVSNYFEQLKEPIDQLNEFINHFNNDITVTEINSDKVSILQNSANGITAIQTAIDAVKNALGSAVDASWNGNMASGGILGAAVGFLIGDGNPNASGLKSGLDELYLSVKDIMDFNTRISGLTGGSGGGDTANIQNTSNMVSALQTEINNLKTTLSGAVPTVRGVAKGMGSAIVSGFKEGMSTWSGSVKTILSSSNGTFKSSGETYGDKLKTGFKDKAKIKDTASAEVGYTFTYLDGKEQDFYDKGAKLGDALSRGFKDHDGLDQHSPGRMARAVSDELGFIGDAFSLGNINLPQMASGLAQTLSNNFAPSFNIGNLQLPNLDQFKQGLSSIPSMVGNVKTQVTTNFQNIQTGVGNSFSGIVSNTKSSLANMQSQTTKNISGIKTSWKGMQTALIASAEHIRSQTTSKINKIKSNMGDFWRKIKNPETLLGSAGGHTGSIKRRYGSSSKLKGLYAGGTNSKPLFKPVRSKGQPSDASVMEYLKCLMETGKPCYAGWSYNWKKPIQNRFTKWKTNFGQFHLDDYLNVGKFSNSSFPVKGNAEVAKAYIFDVIRSTTYGKYFNSNFGDDPVAALRAGVFNCWDGTNIVLSLARAFGFDGSRGHGTWNGIGHVWANIPGLGIIDPTAIQQNGSFTSSAVKGYHAGSIRRGSSGGDVPTGETNTYNTNVEIHVHGDDVEVNNRRIDKRTGKQLLDILGINPATGR